jgi:hypothetical protein
MPSDSLKEWTVTRCAALDELEAIHRTVGGLRPGRRYATQQINHAYAVLISSQFQGFCRSLHTECSEFLVQGIVSHKLQTSLRNLLTQNRQLDRGSPNPGNIGSDFNRFGILFWPEVQCHDQRNLGRQTRLEDLGRWRNAIAHQDFTSLGKSSTLHLKDVRDWRDACNQLARSFDDVMRSYINQVTGTTPW